MRVRFIELAEPLREGGLEKAAADMASYLTEAGVEVFRGEGPVDAFGPVDLVHFHGLWSPAHLQAARWCRKKGVPVVVSPHGMLEPWAWHHRKWKKWPYFFLFERARLSRADAILATAEAEAGNIRKRVPNGNIVPIPLGIETDILPDYAEARQTLGWDDGERVLLYLSRVHPKKGLLELVQSLLKIHRKGCATKTRLVILGDGPSSYVETCRSEVENLKEFMPVDWLPPQWGEAKWKYLQGADLFCLPTYSENFGIVVLEAGLVGTPVFTTTGTPWKHVEEAGFGWVVEPDPAIYPDAVRQFLETGWDELKAMREPFAEWTKAHYAWPVLVRRYIEFYKQVLTRSK